MVKGVKFRLYPNKEQQNLINRTFGCCRLIYNKALELRKTTYKQTGKGASYSKTAGLIPELSRTDGYSFLKEVSSVAMQQSLRDLDTAYQRFFKHLGSYPNYKRKSDTCQSFRIVNQMHKNGTYKIRIAGNYIHIPTLGYVKFRQTMPIGTINNVTVERSATNKYYVVVNTACDDVHECFIPSDRQIGIDVGIKCFLTDTDGNRVDNPKWLRKSLKRLRREQRRLSRMMQCHITGYTRGRKGGRVPVFDTELSECRNYQKQKRKIASIHEKIADQRYDFQQKLSTNIVKDNQFIGVEHLSIRGMKRNHKLALSISDAGWGQFIRMLTYKAEWYGRVLVKVPTFYPSSQLCHVCGYKNTDVKDLNVREWECPVCHTKHDRDKNASDNILSKALEIYKMSA